MNVPQPGAGAASGGSRPALSPARCDCCGSELDETLFCVACGVDSAPDQMLVPDPLWDGDERRPDRVLVAADGYLRLCRSCCPCFLVASPADRGEG